MLNLSMLEPSCFRLLALQTQSYSQSSPLVSIPAVSPSSWLQCRSKLATVRRCTGHLECEPALFSQPSWCGRPVSIFSHLPSTPRPLAAKLTWFFFSPSHWSALSPHSCTRLPSSQLPADAHPVTVPSPGFSRGIGPPSLMWNAGDLNSVTMTRLQVPIPTLAFILTSFKSLSHLIPKSKTNV